MTANTITDADWGFASSWERVGLHAANVWAAGEIDCATAPQLAQTLQAAVDVVPLTVLGMQEVTFMDCSGMRVILEATAAARATGHRLVVVGLRPHVEAVFTWTGSHASLDVTTEGPDLTAGGAVAISPEPAAAPENPVNATVMTARVMAVPDRQLWLQAGDGGVQRAWAPGRVRPDVSLGGSVELYVDHTGGINGWWDQSSGLAVNQRHLDHTAPPLSGEPMVCQGRCGLVWHAPAAERLAEFDERCLTCAGPLAPG